MVQIPNKVESASCVKNNYTNTYTVARLAQNILRHAQKSTYKKKEGREKKAFFFYILIFSQTVSIC